jgi:hypothetical protein
MVSHLQQIILFCLHAFIVCRLHGAGLASLLFLYVGLYYKVVSVVETSKHICTMDHGLEPRAASRWMGWIGYAPVSRTSFPRHAMQASFQKCRSKRVDVQRSPAVCTCGASDGVCGAAATSTDDVSSTSPSVCTCGASGGVCGAGAPSTDDVSSTTSLAFARMDCRTGAASGLCGGFGDDGAGASGAGGGG